MIFEQLLLHAWHGLLTKQYKSVMAEQKEHLDLVKRNEVL